MWRALELNGHFSDTLRQRLARAQVERHPGPAPVVNIQLHGRIGLSGRIRRHARFVPVAYERLPVGHARTVLPADRMRQDLFVTEGPHGVQHFRLLVAHRF